ncbi:MAG: hypothetical protein HYU64_13550 [Armatimonadetes bacterium]|nr:hypothetical protein [Armatimonadota bacterium]
MGLNKGLKPFLFLAALLALAGPSPAFACTPIMSVGYYGVMAGYLVWVVLALIFAWRYGALRYDFAKWAILVPIGFFWFAVPIAILALPAAILFLAFPMHLAVEFCTALFDNTIPRGEKIPRLIYFGLPTLVILGLGIAFKILIYAREGGLRAFVWNYSEGGTGLIFFGFSLLIGLIVAFRARRADRRNQPAL